jgi:hypothetical protein
MGLPYTVVMPFKSILSDFIAYIMNEAKPPHSYYVQAMAYANVLCKKLSRAEKFINLNISILHTEIESEFAGPWLKTELEQNQEILGFLKTDPNKAIETLLSWENITREKLGIQDL